MGVDHVFMYNVSQVYTTKGFHSFEPYDAMLQDFADLNLFPYIIDLYDYAGGWALDHVFMYRHVQVYTTKDLSQL
jgi:hypothetical protein